MRKHNILIVEDEPAMLSGLPATLAFEGYNVDTAIEGDSGLHKILNNDYSLVLLDVMLPNLSGFDICRKVRNDGIKTPIILLTAKGEEMDKVLGLEFGADDYITKPFGLRELLARIKAVIRRTDDSNDNKTNNNNNITIGNLKVNFNNYEAFNNNEQIKLSFKEFEILHYLWDKRNSIVSRDDILNDVWGNDYQPTSRTIDNFILKLRSKIENDPNRAKIILTVHGVGYKLIDS